MKFLGHSFPKKRTGLTLLELLVVLTILIALGGIVVASFPGLLRRTQAATAAANVPEIDSAIRRGLVTNQGRIGNSFDSLVVGNSSVAKYVGGSQNFTAASLTDSDVKALQEVGITKLVVAIDTEENVTFTGHAQDAVDLGSESKVCQLSAEYAAVVLKRIWNLEPKENFRYLLFGIGQKCSLVGGDTEAVFKESPVHFSDNNLSNPKNMYSRYLIVVELDGSNTIQSKARYIGTAIPHQTGIIGINDQLEDYYSQ